MKINKVYQGDCLEVMAKFPDNSIDTIITDPPWGLKFMGKHWDHGIPGVAFWEEMLRVAKPGATLMAFGGTRTHHRLMVAIEDASWEIRDCMMWLYAQGFPKSTDVSKQLDKMNGKTAQDIQVLKDELQRVFDVSGLTLAQLNEQCGFEASGYLRKSSTWASVLPSPEKWQSMRNVIGTNDDFSSEFKEAERKIIGKLPWTNSSTHFDSNKDDPKRVQLNVTAPSFSINTQSRPVLNAASAVVPDPAKGSSTMPPVGVLVKVQRYSKTLSDFTVG